MASKAQSKISPCASSSSLNNDLMIAHTSINMIINNEWTQCEELLIKYKDTSCLLSYCFGYLSFVKSIFLFEEAQFDKAVKDLDNTQKLCKDSLKQLTALIKKRNQSTSDVTKQNVGHSNLIEDKIFIEILIADCKLFISLLILMKQDVTQIIKTALFELRRAWKIYYNLQKYLFNLFKSLDSNAEEIYGQDPNKLPNILLDEQDDANCSTNNASINNNDLNEDLEVTSNDGELSLNAVKNLLASVSFGFGIIQLSFSFLSPNILKLLKFIGFEAERNVALKALFFTSQSKDIRSPFADMIVIMYSTMYIQMCGTNETDMHLNYKELQIILDKNLNKNPKSCLFLLFKAKNEFINKNIDQALETYLIAHEYTSNIRELATLNWYELGLIYVINLNNTLAFECFKKFTENSKWSYAFNAYLTILLNGSLGYFQQFDDLLKTKIKLAPRKNPIEIYSLKRIEFIKKLCNESKYTPQIYQFLLLELAFLWCYLPYAKRDNLIKMLEMLYIQTEKVVYPITSLIEGVIRIELDNKEFAEQLFKETIKRIDNEKQATFEKYVLPFSYFNLSALYVDKNNLDIATQYLNKVKLYKDYDHEDRLLLQVQTLNRRIEYKKSLLSK